MKARVLNQTVPAAEAAGRDLKERMRFSRFTPEDAKLLQGLRGPFQERAGEIVEIFYRHLSSFGALSHLISDPESLSRLKRVLASYVVSLTRKDHGRRYVQDRLRMGQTHEQIGLAPQWYLGAYCVLLDQLLPIVNERYADEPGKATRATLAVSKLMNLDMQIALDAYFETRQRRAVERSERLAAVGELAASIAHEVRNPLAGMKGALQVLRKDLVLDSSKRDVMDELLAQIVRLENLVRDLLNYARPNPLNLQPVDLHNLLDRSLRLLQDSVERSGITVSRTYGPHKSPIVADPLQLEQVFLNLIGNAVQAMGEGGTLTITTRFKEESVDILFQDEGKGIPPGDLPHIFQPFYTTKHRGSGLGLSIVKKIVEAHGGTVEVDSAPGEGTTAAVTLPRLEAE
jgi:signal transduction histidine kinase